MYRSTSLNMSNDVEQNGWTAVPVDAGKIFESGPFLHQPQLLLVEDIQFPENDLVAEVQQYANHHLTRQCYNHSMRVYYFGKYVDNDIV